jgi:pimeloyl-ACP methyl ester carboxylesterase
MNSEVRSEGTWPEYALLDRAGASGTMFYPRPDPHPAPPGASDHLIEVEPGIAVAARFYAFDPARPTILYFHGNGEIASDHDPLAPLYRQAGANLFVAEFRGYGRSTGSPTLAHLVADAHPIVRHFHEHLDGAGFAGRRFVMGRSLGTHPALEVAAHAGERFHGLIVESGAAGLRRMLQRLGFDPETGAGADLAAAHEAKIRSIRLPLLLIHGEWDELIPLEHALELYELLAEVERELLVIPGAGHNDLMWAGLQSYFEAIARFVSR